MSDENLIKAWKDLDYRKHLSAPVNHPSGKSADELSEEEMIHLFGAEENKKIPRSTMVCGGIVSFVVTYLATELVCKN
ncbi:putative Lichenicidin prepeptide [[Clostridium] ultunense Esp]|uniref:mersacidin/lichenicidin family type 2 lantibiotic n=1 Tax=Thermicanus aegyptius TaxID=94009 RepID=UPI0002B70F74|nr:mersacidin/lichenicidin family type 2 lantibiotic [Thermicanus aegyptius]CCQ95656.1 putative Lichenicidin prepeptide [[Clostridium] ultunense Esp]